MCMYIYIYIYIYIHDLLRRHRHPFGNTGAGERKTAEKTRGKASYQRCRAPLSGVLQLAFGPWQAGAKL